MVAANSMITHYEDVNTEETFITQQEYGKQLYNNPRGISCKSCHGEFGKGQQLAQYKHKGKLQEIYAPDITELDISRFKKKLYSNRGVMPKYYLTDSEIEAIYEYITQK
nr:cytochrome c [Helicobacter aurati]